MRIVGLILLGLLLLNGCLNIVMNIVGLASGVGSSNFMFGRLMGSVAITALIGFFFLKLLKKGNG